jgi:hypothetical protein
MTDERQRGYAMTEVAALNRDAAKRHPESVFGSPLNIINEIMLTKGEKLAALSRWRLSIISDLDAPNVSTRGQLAVLGPGDTVRLRAGTEPGRLLLLAGVPLREPVARYGPFVMNTEQEIVTAVRDFQSGRMGEITRTAKVG